MITLEVRVLQAGKDPVRRDTVVVESGTTVRDALGHLGLRDAKFRYLLNGKSATPDTEIGNFEIGTVVAEETPSTDLLPQRLVATELPVGS